MGMKQVVIFLSIFVLTGCGVMNSHFDCPHKPGVMCRSLDQVNAMVSKGVFDKKHNKRIKIPKFYKVNSLSLKSSIGGNPRKRNIEKKRVTQKPLRSGERVVRVWVAPYQDIEGNYHNESEIYTAVNKNRWIVPKKIKKD